MVSRDQVRNDLLAAYKRRKDDSFVQTLLRGISDPVKPLSEMKRRRFHPLFITGLVLIAACLILALWLSR